MKKLKRKDYAALLEPMQEELVADFNDQKRGRLALIRDLLDRLPDTKVPPGKCDMPPLSGKPRRERYSVLEPIPPFDG